MPTRMLEAQEVSVTGDPGASVSDVSGVSGKENEEDSTTAAVATTTPAVPFPYEATYRSLLAQSQMMVDMTEALCYNVIFAEGDGPDEVAMGTRFDKSANLNYFLVSRVVLLGKDFHVNEVFLTQVYDIITILLINLTISVYHHPTHINLFNTGSSWCHIRKRTSPQLFYHHGSGVDRVCPSCDTCIHH